MSPLRRRLVQGASFSVFVIILAIAARHAPPNLERVRPAWLAAGFVLAALTTILQGVQNDMFLRHEGNPAGIGWATWFAAEKAWLNSILPAKAGTATALVILQRKWGLNWTRYLRFMMLCGGVSAVTSVAAMIVLVVPTLPASALAALAFTVLTAAIRPIFRLPWGALALLGALGLLNLAVLSGGVAACLYGLGHALHLSSIAAIGVAMNTLALVAVTPGNFGVREAALAMLAPLVALDFGIVVQGAACYVFLRLLASLCIASVLRVALLR